MMGKSRQIVLRLLIPERTGDHDCGGGISKYADFGDEFSPEWAPGGRIALIRVCCYWCRLLSV